MGFVKSTPEISCVKNFVRDYDKNGRKSNCKIGPWMLVETFVWIIWRLNNHLASERKSLPEVPGLNVRSEKSATEMKL